MEPQFGEPFNPYRRFRGAMIPGSILRNPDIAPAEKLILARLLQYAGKDGRAWPRVESLGFEVGLGIRQTRRCLRALEYKHGIIRRSESKGGRHRSNDFEFIWGPLWIGETRSNPTEFPEERTAPKGRTSRSQTRSRTTGNPVMVGPKPGQKRPPEENQEENHEKNQANGDLDCAPKNRKKRDSSPHPVLQSKVKPYPLVKEALHEYFREPGYEDLYPSDRLVVDVMNAANAYGYVSEKDFVSCLAYLYDERGLRPGTMNGPKHWSWFPTVVGDYFRQKNDRENAASPAATEWREGLDGAQVNFDETPF